MPAWQKVWHHDLAQSVHAVKTRFEKFESTGSTLRKMHPGPRKTVQMAEADETVNALILRSLQRSVWQHAVSLVLSHRKLLSDLKFHLYKLQVVYNLQACDMKRRVYFLLNSFTKMG